jgi:protocatechuate 3,4-dioxygenase beta subunit
MRMSHDDEELANEFRLSKRSLLGLGLAAAAVPIGSLMAQSTAPAPVGGGGLAGGAGGRPPLPRLNAENVDSVLRRRLSSGNACTVAPQTVEGPYYIDNRLLRSDIREDQVGEPMKLRLQIVDANSICEPMASVLVSVWHANAAGYYSGYHNVVPDRLQPEGTERLRGHAAEQDAERWLRGVQPTDKDGWVTFTTIFPGWYTMRAAHIHVRVFKNEREMATTQFLFSQALVNNIYFKQPYAKRGPGIITNENDLVRQQSSMGVSAVLDSERDASGMLVVTGRVGLSHA